MVGDEYGRLKVISFSHKNKSYRKFWNVQCLCGNKLCVAGPDLKSGNTKSCGCLWKDKMRTHKMSRTPMYKRWIGMKSRCYNPKSSSYKRYGGRGIKVCEEWQDFNVFYKDMGDSPFEGAQLERKDNDGNYSPHNVIWASSIVNNNNTSKNIIITYKGMSLTIGEWAKKLGVSYDTIYGRKYRGWSDSDTISAPIQKHYRNRMAKVKI